MNYKTELHCHSREVSKCASAPAEKIAEYYVSMGYTSLVLANHLSRFTFKNERFGDLSNLPWDKKVDHFMSGYHRLVEVSGDRLHILLGMELRSNRDENDYLVYGVTEEFIRSVPEMMDVKLADVSAAARSAGFLFMQAHPFRNSMRVTKPELLDGIEIYNGNANHDNRNDIARLWSEKFGLIPTSGSDCHTAAEGSASGGIITDSPILDNPGLLEVLRSGRYELIRGSNQPY